MRKSGRNFAGTGTLRAGMAVDVLVLALIVAAAAVLQGCSGTSTPNYNTPTAYNPAPGVILQAINISPSNSLIGLAENRQLFAIGIYNTGSQVDITSQVNWVAASSPNTGNFVSVNSQGIVTGNAIGVSEVTASLGPVTGLLSLLVDTNGYATGTTAILSVPFKSSIVDVAYLPQSTTQVEGAYAVQEVNLDADQSSNVLPVPVALLASVPMPAGFVPNATAAIQSSSLVGVISYSSPRVQIIDASNLSIDLSSNTVIATFSAPVTQSVTINGINCMICAIVANPLNNKFLLSTAQGYYTLDPVAGTFTAIPFTPSPAPSANFSLNPTAASPYILSASPVTGEAQILNLETNAVTTVSSGLIAPGATAIDFIANDGAIVDAATNNQALVDFTNPQSPQPNLVPGVGVCPNGPAFMNMAAMSDSVNVSPQQIVHTLFTSQTSGSCVGFQTWPLQSSGLNPSNIIYWYGNMPPTPDGNAFVNGSDPNTIATFNDVIGSHPYYGLLVDANQQWIARINLTLANSIQPTVDLPGGSLIPPGPPAIYLCTVPEDLSCLSNNNVIYLPTPSTALTVSLPSLNFGTVSVGTPSGTVSVIEANIGNAILNNQLSVTGANAGDFSLDESCGLQLQPHSNCTIGVTFTPSAVGARSATLTVTGSGVGNPQTQTVALSGTGQ